MSKSKWAIAGAIVASIGVGGLLYFLSDDGEDKHKVKFDPKVHNLEYLLDILEDLKLEYASVCVHWYSMMQNIKKQNNGQVPPNVVMQLKVKIEEVTNDVDKEILEKYKISKTFFKKLLKEFEND